MKRKTAKEILAESFREIADNKPVDISCGWIMEHYNMSPKDMALVYIDSLPVLLHNYLLKDG